MQSPERVTARFHRCEPEEDLAFYVSFEEGLENCYQQSSLSTVFTSINMTFNEKGIVLLNNYPKTKRQDKGQVLCCK